MPFSPVDKRREQEAGSRTPVRWIDVGALVTFHCEVVGHGGGGAVCVCVFYRRSRLATSVFPGDPAPLRLVFNARANTAAAACYSPRTHTEKNGIKHKYIQYTRGEGAQCKSRKKKRALSRPRSFSFSLSLTLSLVAYK